MYINLAQRDREGGQEYEYRPTLVRGELQWLLRPVYRLAYFIQRFIRRVRAALHFFSIGYGVRMDDGAQNWTERRLPYSVDLLAGPRNNPNPF